MPAVSVIVPTRKRNHLLPRAVNSILAQTFVDFEIVVVDDNPAESRVANDKSLLHLFSDPRVRLVQHENPRNAARARNQGLVASRGEWVTYLDDDDAYHPRKLEKQWHRALDSGLSLGLCGLVYRLPHRSRVLRRPAEELSGEDLLLYFPGMPAVFHRQAPNMRFDESLDAAEDFHFYQSLVRHFNVSRVFNVPEALVDVYPQVQGRVNLHPEGTFRTLEAVYRQFAPAYGPATAKTFFLRAQLGYCKLRPGCWKEMVGVSVALLRHRGWKEIRLIVNSLLFKLPWLKRWLVS
jgi:glycosyltransferase involved in cell wall biosynthesis